MSAIVVVTALIGPAESMRPPPAFDGVRFVCFTDRRDVAGWERMQPCSDVDSRRAARRAKALCVDDFPEASAVIWMDASFDLLVHPKEIVAAARAPIAGFAHPDRCRISQEAREVMRNRMAPPGAVDAQIEAYRLAGFDSDEAPQRSLTTTGLLVRFVRPMVAAFGHRWWSEMQMHTLRDQLSIDYVAWRCAIEIGRLPGHYRDNAFVNYNRERHRERRAA